MSDEIRMLNKSEVCELLKVSRGVLDRWLNTKSDVFKPNFPQPLKLSNRPIFLYADILQFIAEEKNKAQAKVADKVKEHEEIERYRKRMQAKKSTVIAMQKERFSNVYTPEKTSISKHLLRKMQWFTQGGK